MNRLDRLNRPANRSAYLSYAFILGREIYAYYSVSHTLKPNRDRKFKNRKAILSREVIIKMINHKETKEVHKAEGSGCKKLSIREKRLIKAKIEGKSNKQAMLEAGYAESTAMHKASAKIAELAPTIQDLMDQHGLTDDRLIEVLEDGLNAKKVISCNVIAPSGNGMKDADSMTKDFVDVEDHAVRYRYLEAALKLKGHLRERIDLDLNVGLAKRIADARKRLLNHED